MLRFDFNRHRGKASLGAALVDAGAHLLAGGQDEKTLEQRHGCLGRLVSSRPVYRRPRGEEEVDPVARLQHAGDRVDFIDRDGQRADAWFHPVGEGHVFTADDRRGNELLAAAQRSRQPHAVETVELIGADSAAGNEVLRNASKRHGLRTHDIAFADIVARDDDVDCAWRLGRETRALRFKLLGQVALAREHRDCTARERRCKQRGVAMCGENRPEICHHGIDREKVNLP
jgi:hypothetical protein